jgi:hypothetical protein
MCYSTLVLDDDLIEKMPNVEPRFTWTSFSSTISTKDTVHGNMEAFLKICRVDFHPISVIDIKAVLPTDCITVLQFPAFDFSLDISFDGAYMFESYVLPSGIAWPLFFHFQQENAVACNICYHRTSTHSIAREMEALKQLQTHHDVIWVGNPGIGKTCSQNILFLKYLRNMDKDGISSVAIRINCSLYCIKLKELATSVDQTRDGYCEAGEFVFFAVAFSKLDDLFRLTQDLIEKTDFFTNKTVLFIDLVTGETNFITKLVCCVSLSTDNHNAGSFYRKRGGRVYLIDPPRFIEVLCMLCTLRLFNIKNLPSYQQIKNRFEEIGGTVRTLFSDERYFSAYRADFMSALKFYLSEDHNKPKTYEALPLHWKFVVATFVRKGMNTSFVGQEVYFNGSEYVLSACHSDSPLYSHHMMYVSDFAAFQSRKSIQTTKEVNQLKDRGLAYQVQEAVIQQTLTTYPSRTVSAVKQLRKDIYIEVFDDQNIGKKTLKDSSTFQLRSDYIPIAEQVVKFHATTVKLSITELSDRYVYKCALVNGWVYDFLITKSKTKTLYLFQVTDLNPQQHQIKLVTFLKVLNDLRFPFDWKIELFMFTTAHVSPGQQRGILFQTPSGLDYTISDLLKQTKIKPVDRKVIEQFKLLKINAWIIRCAYYLTDLHASGK